MNKAHVTHREFRRAVALGEVEAKLRDGRLSAREESKYRDQKRAIYAFFTPPRVAQSFRWQRRVFDIAMRMYPNMCLPTVKEFLALPEIKELIVSDDAPPHWRNYPLRAVVPIRNALIRANFLVPAGRVGRPTSK